MLLCNPERDLCFVFILFVNIYS